LCVLIIEQEIGEIRLKERAGRIQRFRGGELAPDNLYLISKDLEIQIDTKQGLEILVQEIEKVKPHVVILDPLRKMHQQKEEDSQQMVYLFRCLEQIQKRFELGMILVHHTTKRSEFRNLSNPESLRGSGEIFADVDTAIMLEQPVQNRPERLRLHITLRSDKNPEPVLVTMDPETLWFTTDAKKVAEEL
jgi:RecA-family ATPase